MPTNEDPRRDVATMDDLRAEIAEFRADMHALFTWQTRWILGYTTALAAAIITAAELLQ